MKVLRAFQVINKDGIYALSSTYNEIDENTGEPTRQNAKDSFYAVEPELKGHIDAIEDYINCVRFGQGENIEG